MNDKRAVANKLNAKKSTGAKTAAGKAISAMNATKHGLLSRKLVLEGESHDEFSDLLDELIGSLSPDGMLEMMLVEKIAQAFWRQMRLTRAEGALIQTQQLPTSIHFKRMAMDSIDKDALGFYSAVKGFTHQDIEDVDWYSRLMAEVESLDDIPHEEKLSHIRKACPMLLDCIDDETENIEDEWPAILADTTVWARASLQELDKKRENQAILELVKVASSAPINNELLHRYQVAIDGELYRAIVALQKQQEHRIKMNLGGK